MITVKFPKFYIDYIEILIAKEVFVFINVWFGLNIEQTFKDF